MDAFPEQEGSPVNLDTVEAFVALAAFFLTFAVAILGGMKWMLARMEQRTDERFDRVDRRFDQRFDRLEASTDERFARVDRQFGDVDRRFAEVDRRFAEIDGRFAEVGATLTDIKIALARIEGPHPPFLIARG